jgi:hypothetical protein
VPPLFDLGRQPWLDEGAARKHAARADAAATEVRFPLFEVVYVTVANDRNRRGWNFGLRHPLQRRSTQIKCDEKKRSS